jgi:hypothetical protein
MFGHCFKKIVCMKTVDSMTDKKQPIITQVLNLGCLARVFSFIKRSMPSQVLTSELRLISFDSEVLGTNNIIRRNDANKTCTAHFATNMKTDSASIPL